MHEVYFFLLHTHTGTYAKESVHISFKYIKYYWHKEISQHIIAKLVVKNPYNC